MIVLRIQKKYTKVWLYAAVSIATSQILKFVFHKNKNLDISRTKHYFFYKKNHYLNIKGYFMAKNTFVAKVTFKIIIYSAKIDVTLSSKVFFFFAIITSLLS